jgi:hypothetical protein
VRPVDQDGRYRLCDNYVRHDVCNWAIPMQQESPLCVSCELNTDIPNTDSADAKVAWARLETAKRRLLYSLLGLRLPIDRRSPQNATGLAFSFKSSSADEPVFTGHSEGLITINTAEADDPFREKTRREMGEPYRTLLGHFRHEIGHSTGTGSSGSGASSSRSAPSSATTRRTTPQRSGATTRPGLRRTGPLDS